MLFAIIAYRIQADRFGDLDHETRQLLDRTAANEMDSAVSARLVSFDRKHTELTPERRRRDEALAIVSTRRKILQRNRSTVLEEGFDFAHRPAFAMGNYAHCGGAADEGVRADLVRDRDDHPVGVGVPVEREVDIAGKNLSSRTIIEFNDVALGVRPDLHRISRREAAG